MTSAQTAIALLLLGIALLLFLNRRRSSARTRGTTPTPAAGTPAAGATRPLWKRAGESILSIFDAGTLAIIAALLFLEFALWKYAPWPWARGMFRGWGLMHIPMYIIAIVIISQLELHTRKKRYALGMAAMVVALTIIGLSHTTLLDQVFDWFAGSSSSTITQAAVCPGKVQRETLTLSPKSLNPGGNCHIRVAEVIRGQCLKAYDRWGDYIDSDCRSNLPVVNGRKVQVVKDRYSESFTAGDGFSLVPVTYVLCDKSGNTNDVVDGCP